MYIYIQVYIKYIYIYIYVTRLLKSPARLRGSEPPLQHRKRPIVPNSRCRRKLSGDDHKGHRLVPRRRCPVVPLSLRLKQEFRTKGHFLCCNAPCVWGAPLAPPHPPPTPHSTVSCAPFSSVHGFRSHSQLLYRYIYTHIYI